MNLVLSLSLVCDSRGIQTHNLLIRSQMLYSVELGSLVSKMRVQRYTIILNTEYVMRNYFLPLTIFKHSFISHRPSDFSSIASFFPLHCYAVLPRIVCLAVRRADTAVPHSEQDSHEDTYIRRNSPILSSAM